MRSLLMLRIPPGVSVAPSDQLAELLSGLETDRVAGRDRDFDARLGIAPDSALASLDLEDAEAAQLDAVPGAQRGAHGLDHGLDRGGGLGARDRSQIDDEVDDVRFDHVLPSGTLPIIISLSS